MFVKATELPYDERVVTRSRPVEPLYNNVQTELLFKFVEFVPSRVIVNGSRPGKSLAVAKRIPFANEAPTLGVT